MPYTNLDEWIARLRDQFLALLTLDLGLQISAIVLTIVLGWILRPFTLRLIHWLDRRRQALPFLRQARWLGDSLAILAAIRWPLTAYMFCRLSLSLLTAIGYDGTVLAWAAPLFLLWLANWAFRTLFERRQPPERAHVWSNQIVRPLLLGIGLLQALTLFDDLWMWHINLGEASFTMGALVVAVVIFIVFAQLARTSRALLGETVLPHAGVHPTLTQVISTLFGYIVILAGFLTALGIVGIQLTTLVVVLGGLSVGLGFALQDVISNFVSGFILLFDRTIVPGDVVLVDERFGRVTNIGIRTTRLRTLDNVEVIVPNSSFLLNTVEKFSSSDAKVRIEIVVRASYTTEPYLVEKALLEAAEGMPILQTPAASVQFIDFGASSLDFRLLVWLSDRMQASNVQSQIRYRIWDRFQAHSIPVPVMQEDVQIVTLPGGLSSPTTADKPLMLGEEGSN